MQNDYCFNLAMRKSARLITQFYEERLSKAGIKVGQFSILRAVYITKETTNKALQSILVLEQTTLTRNLKPLLRDGYLKQTVDPDDGRNKLISLTAEGKALYRKALPLWQSAQDELQQKIGIDESKKVLEMSDIFVKSLANN